LFQLPAGWGPLKVLIVKPSSLGDVVHALPVLRLIKKHLPDSKVYWWIKTSLAPLLEGDPDLAGLIPFDRWRWRWPWHWHEAWQSLQTLRRHRFDWILDLQGLLRSGIVSWLANGSRVAGLEDNREGVQAFFDVALPCPFPNAHIVDRYLSVLPLLGVPASGDFQWLPVRSLALEAVNSRWHPGGLRWIILAPGARWANKRWPAEYYAELVRLLAERQPDLQFAILGAAYDRDLGAFITSANPGRCLDLTGLTTLPELIEWLRLGEVVVTNDTGPLHLAAAMDKPLVALFGPTNPLRSGPYGKIAQVMQANLPCVPCMKDFCRLENPLECLRVITPAAVARKIEESISHQKNMAVK